MGVFQNNLMGAAAAAASGGGGTTIYDHQIAKSARFQLANSSYMYRTPSSAGNRRTWTYSTWVKRTKYNINTSFFGATRSGYENVFRFEDTSGADRINLFGFTGAGLDFNVKTTASYRDSSAWYHIVIAMDTTQGTSSNRLKLYVNGEQQTDLSSSSYPSQNYDTNVNDTSTQTQVGYGSYGGQYFDGYIAESVLIDGTQYAASDFGETVNGVWVPKDPSGLTFGTNGFYLNYASSGDLGNDVSGNNNDLTVSGVAAHDSMLDSPTFNSSSNGGNFATYNPLTAGSYISLSEGNLQTIGTTVGDEGSVLGTMGVTSGKWYWEVRMINMRYSTPAPGISAGSASATQATTTGGPRNLLYYAGNSSNFLRDFDSTIWGTVTEVETGLAGFSAGDKMMIALDVDNKKVWYGKNGSWFNSGNPATGANPQQSWTGTGFSINPSIQEYDSSSSSSSCANFGQDGTFAGTETAQGNSDDTGYGNFYYDPPTGFLAMCSGNLPIADAIDPAQTDDNYPQKLFNTKLYTGTGSSNAITGLGFQPDLTWVKQRNGTNDYKLTDSTRGVTKSLESNTVVGEATDSNGLTAFGTDGFTVGSDSVYNGSSNTFLSWNWRANGGTTTTDTSGNIDGVYQTNDCGFSIMKYSGNGSNAQTVPHGVKVGGEAVAPSYVIMKNLPDSSNNWRNWSIGYNDGDADSYAEFNGNAWLANQGSGGLFTAKPTSTMLTLTDYSAINASGKAVIVYSFANVEGFIKSGSYVGNANDDGTFLYLGFKPAFFMCKPIVAGNWRVQDNIRSPINVAHATLFPNNNNAEETNDSNDIDFLSNGVKMRASDSNYNQATTFVYLAMAENPFQFATAR